MVDYSRGFKARMGDAVDGKFRDFSHRVQSLHLIKFPAIRSVKRVASTVGAFPF